MHPTDSLHPDGMTIHPYSSFRACGNLQPSTPFLSTIAVDGTQSRICFGVSVYLSMSTIQSDPRTSMYNQSFLHTLKPEMWVPYIGLFSTLDWCHRQLFTTRCYILKLSSHQCKKIPIHLISHQYHQKTWTPKPDKDKIRHFRLRSHEEFNHLTVLPPFPFLLFPEERFTSRVLWADAACTLLE